MDPSVSRSSAYLDDNWPQMTSPRTTFNDDRPPTDESQAIAGAAWPNLKGSVYAEGVGTMSFHDREMAVPLSTVDPALRARPSVYGQNEQVDPKITTITYKNVPTSTAGPGSDYNNTYTPPPPTMAPTTAAPTSARRAATHVTYGSEYENVNIQSQDYVAKTLWQGQIRFTQQFADPRGSRAPGYLTDTFPQYMRPNSTLWDDRPATDPSESIAGASWPTLKGIHRTPGVGNLSYHDRETAQPLSALDPMVRARPTYLGQVEPATADVHTITYKNVATKSSGPGSSGTNSNPEIRRVLPPAPPNDYMTRPDLAGTGFNYHAWQADVGDGLAADPQSSRASGYTDDVWPQYTRPNSTWDDDRPGSDPALAVGGASWPTLKGLIVMPGIGNISFHDRETTQPLSALDPMVRSRPTYRGQVEPNSTDVHTITYKNVATTSTGPGLSGSNGQASIFRTFPPPPPNEYMQRPDLTAFPTAAPTSARRSEPEYTHGYGPWLYSSGPGNYTGVGDGLEVDPQASRAPDYAGNNWPQYMRPDSTWGDAPDPSLVLGCQQAVQPGYEQPNAQYFTRGAGAGCQGFPTAVDPTARPFSDEWGAQNNALYDSLVGNMTIATGDQVAPNHNRSTVSNAPQSRASQAPTLDAGSQFGWERTWDPRGQRVMDAAPAGVISDDQGSSTPTHWRPESPDWYRIATGH